MIKEEIGYGETVEEAWEQAKANLVTALAGTKFDEDEIQFDVIATPKKKTLGLFGGSKAEVKAYIELPDAKPAKAKTEKPKKAEKPAKNSDAKAEKPAKKAAAPKKEKVAEPSTEELAAVSAGEVPADSPAGKAIAYISGILASLGCTNTEIKAAVRENGAALYISGDGLGVVIGRRGETLDSLQYLASLAANSAKGYYKITLNIGDYRERREQTLTSLARRVSSQVLRTGRQRTLEPMNPYERRIIHTAVQEIEGVSSHSVGEGSGRRVVISSTNSRQMRRNSGNRTSSAPVTDTAREPKRDAEIPLYGKIN